MAGLMSIRINRTELERIASRVWRMIARNLRLVDLIDCVMLALACGLAINGLSTSAVATAILGTLYLVATAVKLAAAVRSRLRERIAEAEVLWGLFNFLNDEIFNGDNGTRFTLFKQDPTNRARIVPWYRYRKGGSDPIGDAEGSRASYGRGEGATGQAWESAGDGDLFFAPFPEFEDRADFEEFYVNQMHVSPETASQISHYMMNVGAIFSVGYCDTRGKFLGVLSIDLRMPIVTMGPLVLISGVDQIEVRSDQLLLICQSIRSVLRSFAEAAK